MSVRGRGGGETVGDVCFSNGRNKFSSARRAGRHAFLFAKNPCDCLRSTLLDLAFGMIFICMPLGTSIAAESPLGRVEKRLAHGSLVADPEASRESAKRSRERATTVTGTLRSARVSIPRSSHTSLRACHGVTVVAAVVLVDDGGPRRSRATSRSVALGSARARVPRQRGDVAADDDDRRR